MDECELGELWPQVICILTYGGDVWHSSINYSLTAITLGCCSLPYLRRIHSYENLVNNRTVPRPRTALFSLAWTTSFQIGLCLVLHCSGISIVWCAGAGWLWLLPAPEPSRRIILLADTLGALYYAFTAPAITTVAHGCAFAMGLLLYLGNSTSSVYE